MTKDSMTFGDLLRELKVIERVEPWYLDTPAIVAVVDKGDGVPMLAAQFEPVPVTMVPFVMDDEGYKQPYLLAETTGGDNG